MTNTRSRISWRRGIGAIFALTALLSGCAQPTSQASRTAAEKAKVYQTRIIDTEPTGDPVRGGTLTIAGGGEPTILDPTVTPGHAAVGGTELAAIYDTLMRYVPEDSSFVPQLAQSLTANQQNTVVTVKLRPGVTFSDGTPLSAGAVVASFERYLAAPAALDSALLSARVKKVAEVDDRTVQFRFTRPWSNFASMLAAGPGMVVAPAAYAGKDFRPIGAGPFELDHHAPGEELVLNARADYWDGAPLLDHLRVVWLGGDDARSDALANGDVDAAYVSNAQVIEDLVSSGTHGFLEVLGMSPGYLLGINQRKGRPGEDLRVRKAIQLAVDPKVFMQRAVGGAGMATGELLPEDSPWNPGDEAPSTDPDQARKLVAQARADGFDGQLNLVTGSEPVARAGGLAIKAMLEAVGFEVAHDLVPNPTTITQRVMIEHDYDIATTGLPLSDDDPASRLYSGLSSTSVFNTSGIDSAEMDEVLDELLAAGPEQRQEVMAKLQHLWWREIPGVVLAAGSNFTPWRDQVHGVVPTKNMIVLLGDAWIEDEG